MKCNDYEQYILLESSNELDREQAARLQAHLESCPPCRAFKRDMLAIRDYSQLDENALRISEFTQFRISSEGRKAIEGRKGAEDNVGRGPPWRLAYAAAAVLLIGMGIFLFSKDAPNVASPHRLTAERPAAASDTLLAWDDDFDQNIASIDEDLIIASIALQEDYYYSDLDTADTEDLASELLTMEESS
ncbi:MAG: zf-HC2 domain-containing protein [Spartobacteria bacterium]|nr:zf-HC2 domain-containing protein [Spartobacteria bacterium]